MYAFTDARKQTQNKPKTNPIKPNFKPGARISQTYRKGRLKPLFAARFSILQAIADSGSIKNVVEKAAIYDNFLNVDVKTTC